MSRPQILIWARPTSQTSQNQNRSMKYRIIAIALVACFLATENRTSADIIQFIATGAAGEGLLAGNINPPTGELGTGAAGLSGIFFDTDNDLLHIDVEWGSGNGYVDLSADVFKLHLHGPTPSSGTAAFGEVAPLLITLSNSTTFDGSLSSGGVNDNFLIDGTNVQQLLDGRMYINVHLTDTDTGVIRGYLQPVPEPGSLIVLGALGALASLRRRRTRLR